MIQRIQSVWLLLAAASGAALYYFDVYRYDKMYEGGVSTMYLGAANNPILLVLALLMIVLPLVAIFLFKNRKKQKQMAVLSILADIGFAAAAIMISVNISNQSPPPANTSYLPGIILPVVSLVFLILAMRGIRKDDKLIKSLDRLR